jgi:thiopurine S-methyltransferase
MNPEFWRAKWQTNEIGFHQSEVHPLLSAHWSRLIPTKARVLVPLCGKSHDLAWLQSRGHRVVGFELSEVAVSAFFAERALVPQIASIDPFERYEANGFEIYCGDFFAAKPDLCGFFDAVYDRAALIALEPAQRATYLATVRNLCALRASGLLITVEYPDGLVLPPPFSVPEVEVMQRYSPWCEISTLARQESDVKGKPALEVAYHFVVGS